MFYRSAASTLATPFVTVIAALLALVVFAVPSALAGPRKPKVLYLHSDSLFPAGVTDAVNKLKATGLFAQVDSLDAHFSTPTLAALEVYDAVMISNEEAWADRTALGNVMAQYVDAGFGVVQANYTTGGVPNSNLGGNWTATYNCITFGPATFGTSATLDTIAQPDHAIMNGVLSLNGGPSSVRPGGTALTAGALLVASWSDGKPLVAVGPKINRCDLGFYPPSSDARVDLWASNTDGVKLLANSLLYVMRPRVALVYSDQAAYPITDPQAKIISTGQFSEVGLIDAKTGTPTLDQLKKYDAVMVINEQSWFNRDALGNVMADYADAGYGVVLTVFTVAGAGGSNLGGRWDSQGYSIIPFGSAVTGAATLGAIVYGNHPVMNSVASFNGGTLSYRTNAINVSAPGYVIARWSDGKVLAAGSTKFHNRADLGFWPVSSTVRSDLWQVNTDGAKLLANSLMYTIRPFVAIAHSETFFPDATSNLVTRLTNSHRFSGVNILPTLDTATPSVAALDQFGALFSFSDANFADANAVGENFATYVDHGGGVVQAVFSVTGNAAFATSRPRGRWISQGYDITPEGSTGASITGAAGLGAFIGPAHPVQSFVRRFDGGSDSSRQGNNPVLRGRRLLEWSDGKMLASLHSFRRRVDLGFWPVSSADGLPSGWNSRTDGTTLIANSLEFAARMKPCPGDFNGDGFVDDTDFTLFLSPYNNLLDPRADLNGDGLSDDADFTLFVKAYNDLICP
ncbi:MAG: hypothetical protein ACREJD_16485 [Phycisphaerales bacterium]